MCSQVHFGHANDIQLPTYSNNNPCSCTPSPLSGPISLADSSDDDESFADCPSSFNSPAVNKLLHLDRASGEVRQSFGLDGLTQNFGKFTFDSANTTLDVVRPESDPGPLLPEAAAEEEEQATKECVVVEEVQVQREDHKQPPEIEIPPEEAVLPEAPSALHNNDIHHTEELDDIACDYDDVEMMSVVMENGIDEDYSNIPLPAEDEEESFPDPPPPHELEQVTPLETTITVAASESAVQDTDPHQQQQLQIANESYSMDVDVEEASPFKSQSEILPGSPGNPVEVVSAPTPPDVVVAQPAEEQDQFISIKKTKSMDASRTSGEFNNDFKMPILRRSLNNQPLVAANPFDDAAAGVGDHKQEGTSYTPMHTLYVRASYNTVETFSFMEKYYILYLKLSNAKRHNPLSSLHRWPAAEKIDFLCGNRVIFAGYVYRASSWPSGKCGWV